VKLSILKVIDIEAIVLGCIFAAQPLHTERALRTLWQLPAARQVKYLSWPEPCGRMLNYCHSIDRFGEPRSDSAIDTVGIANSFSARSFVVK
jgi:hypothetical protein